MYETTRVYCLNFSKDGAAERCEGNVLVQNVLECSHFFAFFCMNALREVESFKACKEYVSKLFVQELC